MCWSLQDEHMFEARTSVIAFDVGLFEQCSYTTGPIRGPQPTTGCGSVRYTEIVSNDWKVSVGLFIFGFVMALATLVYLVAALQYGERPFVTAKWFRMLSNLLFIVSWSLMMAGIEHLDESCDASRTTHCDLARKAGAKRNFGSDLMLPAPWQLGSAGWVMFVALVIYFAASFFGPVIERRRSTLLPPHLSPVQKPTTSRVGVFPPSAPSFASGINLHANTAAHSTSALDLGAEFVDRRPPHMGDRQMPMFSTNMQRASQLSIVRGTSKIGQWDDGFDLAATALQTHADRGSLDLSRHTVTDFSEDVGPHAGVLSNSSTC